MAACPDLGSQRSYPPQNLSLLAKFLLESERLVLQDDDDTPTIDRPLDVADRPRSLGDWRRHKEEFLGMDADNGAQDWRRLKEEILHTKAPHSLPPPQPRQKDTQWSITAYMTHRRGYY